MRRCNIIPLILVLSIVNFALAAPALLPGKCQACDGVVHVPRDVITVFEKRGDESNWMMRLLETFDSWLPGGSSSSESSLESGSEETDPAETGSERSDSEEPGSVDWGSGWDSVESGSEEPDPVRSGSEELDPVRSDSEDRESVDVDDDAPGVSSPESSIKSGYSSMLPPDSGRYPIGMYPSGWDSDSDLDSDSDSERWSTISNAPSAESLFENLQTANAALKGKAKVERRITGTARGVANAA